MPDATFKSVENTPLIAVSIAIIALSIKGGRAFIAGSPNRYKRGEGAFIAIVLLLLKVVDFHSGSDIHYKMCWPFI